MAPVHETQDPLALYDRHGEGLARVRAEQAALYERAGYANLQRYFPYRWARTASRRLGMDWERTRFMNPQLDDIEAELTYLRIREARPERVVEISPFRGWSTTWMLRALRDNGGGSLLSFDLIRDSERFVPAELSGNWTLLVGDVRDRLPDMPAEIDYLFLDSDHRAGFAQWYLDELVPRMVPGAGGSIHDVFHGGRPSAEAKVVLEWLERERIPWFTPSRFGSGKLHDDIQRKRMDLGIAGRIHTGDHDSMVFFSR